MIIRRYAACEECGTVHILRIGVGGEKVQAHQFACTYCRSEMNLRLELGVGTTFGPNAVEVEPNDEAPIINLHPSFVFDMDEIHCATAFPSSKWARAWSRTWLPHAELPDIPANSTT